MQLVKGAESAAGHGELQPLSVDTVGKRVLQRVVRAGKAGFALRLQGQRLPAGRERRPGESVRAEPDRLALGGVQFQGCQPAGGVELRPDGALTVLQGGLACGIQAGAQGQEQADAAKCGLDLFHGMGGCGIFHMQK